MAFTDQVGKALRQGWETVRRSKGGESVVFRGQSLPALVDLTGGEFRTRTAPDLNTLRGAVVEVEVSRLPAEPRPGEYLTDKYGASHRINSVALRGPYYRLTCDPL